METQGLILFDDESAISLYPLTLNKPVGELRCGIIKLRQKWELLLQKSASYITRDYLSDKYPVEINEDNLIINASVLANKKLVRLIKDLNYNESLMYGDELIAARLSGEQIARLVENQSLDSFVGYELDENLVRFIRKPWHLFQNNAQQINFDYHLLNRKRKSEPIPENCQSIGKDIFIEPGAKLNFVTLNATDGPIYIGRDAEIMEGSNIRGPFAICTNAMVKMGSKIYGGTTIGPTSTVGGELKNAIFQGYSNKGHDGYLGNAFIGEWCNIGAGTDASNLKNNYGAVKIWDYESQTFQQTDLQYCGLVMGDYTKVGIQTMFNTATIVGLGVNVFGGNFQPKFMPSFTWGNAASRATYELDKLLESAKIMMQRRGKELSEEDIKIIQSVFDMTQIYRDAYL